MRLYLTIALSLGCLLALSGCSSRKAPTATVPTSTPEAIALDTQPAVSEGTPSADPAFPEELVLIGERVIVPPLRPGTVVPAPGSATEAEEPRTETVPQRSPQRPRAGGPARPTGAESPSDAETATESRPPSLKPMMSEAERKQLLSQTQANLERARRNLAGIQESRLESNERDALRQARSFLARAEQLRMQDPALASSMAERAAILSQELLRRQR
jgi:hypothetical protein